MMISCFGILIYAMLAEYLIHRFVMHRPLLFLWNQFEEHSIQHHFRGRTDINISISPITVGVVVSPFFVLCFWFGWIWALIVAFSAITYSEVWTILHTAHHDLGMAWIRRLPSYRLWREHHLLHHKYPSKNFGAVFPFTDYLFGTKA